MTTLSEETLCLAAAPTDCAEFEALGVELTKLNHPACPDVDWRLVESLCLTMFREHGVELQSASAFALASAQLHELEGMHDGLGLLNRLLIQGWSRVWPLALPARLEILAWLFAQLQPLLRGLELSVADIPALERLDSSLQALSEQVEGQAQVPLVSLQALRKQLQGVMQRLARDVVPVAGSVEAVEGAAAIRKPLTARRRQAIGARAEPGPTVAVLKLDMTETPPLHTAPDTAPGRRRKASWLWLLLLILLLLVGALLWWWLGRPLAAAPIDSSASSSPASSPVPTAPVQLDSQLLFPKGSAELKPGSTKVLINSLINIKAQPGWQIVVTGHSDSTGDARRNLELSRARAEAVREWMQRMGDIPDDCFVVRGAGSSEPVRSDDTESGRSANRRVEIKLMPMGGACEKR